MENWLIIGILYGAGLFLLLADFFLPSHGLLTLASFAVLGFALYSTFQISEQAGLTTLGLLAVGVPTMLVMAIRRWHRTWVGRRISPPNPVLTEEDRLPAKDLERLIGRMGRSLTPLRPVGMCLFDDQRVECVSEAGMIAANVEVEGIRLSDRTLVVRPVLPRG
ncbi:MAG TPA: NfeD family protein [Phycisphaerae bacterium]|nr:NfeD family protein [Phycisphaerae bacterium]HQE42704.1 NfeD family protein [Phycisphaerae bacterium]